MAVVKGGDDFERALRNIEEGIGHPRHVRVGFLEGATYPDGTPVALVAAVQDGGAPSRGIPPRPFFRNMVADKSPMWGDALAAALRGADYDAGRALALMGEGIRGQLQQSIADYDAGPPLAPATIRAKGFDKQLIDTAHMMNSADFEVRDGEA